MKVKLWKKIFLLCTPRKALRYTLERAMLELLKLTIYC